MTTLIDHLFTIATNEEFTVKKRKKLMNVVLREAAEEEEMLKVSARMDAYMALHGFGLVNPITEMLDRQKDKPNG